ncbi:type 1 glutamine amidotransferase [bacterium]|nr:type 1 glutamine amidotransferase [bacterium]
MSIQGKRVAILVERMYEDLELWYPYYRLKEAGAVPVRVGPGTEKVFPSKYGYPAPVDRQVVEVAASDFDAVVIPGGFAPDFMRRTQAMIDFVTEFARLGRPMAAICHGVWMLCSADALRGKRATCFYAIRHDVIHAGAAYVDEEVVVDGNIITARKPEDLPAFVKALLAALGERHEK